jgi:hypothetical protein
MGGPALNRGIPALPAAMPPVLADGFVFWGFMPTTPSYWSAIVSN